MTQAALLVDKHVAHIVALQKPEATIEYQMTEHLRVSGIYWGLACLHLLGHPDILDRQSILDFVFSCQTSNGSFGGGPATQHGGHLLYTMSAVQILILLDALDLANIDAIVGFIKGLQRADGSFDGDANCEPDTRFTYCAVATLSLLGRLDAIDCHTAQKFVEASRNFDGGYGVSPGAESHAGQIFCCVAALKILHDHDMMSTGDEFMKDGDVLAHFLAERQLPNGGLNGRPEKLEDVCYSWWVLSSLCILGKQHWLDQKKLQDFILSCQDQEAGGIADRAGDAADVYHTFFGVGGLALMQWGHLPALDPVYALPVSLLKNARIQGRHAGSDKKHRAC